MEIRSAKSMDTPFAKTRLFRRSNLMTCLQPQGPSWKRKWSASRDPSSCCRTALPSEVRILSPGYFTDSSPWLCVKLNHAQITHTHHKPGQEERMVCLPRVSCGQDSGASFPKPPVNTSGIVYSVTCPSKHVV